MTRLDRLSPASAPPPLQTPRARSIEDSFALARAEPASAAEVRARGILHYLEGLKDVLPSAVKRDPGFGAAFAALSEQARAVGRHGSGAGAAELKALDAALGAFRRGFSPAAQGMFALPSAAKMGKVASDANGSLARAVAVIESGSLNTTEGMDALLASSAKLERARSAVLAATAVHQGHWDGKVPRDVDTFELALAAPKAAYMELAVLSKQLDGVSKAVTAVISKDRATIDSALKDNTVQLGTIAGAVMGGPLGAAAGGALTSLVTRGGIRKESAFDAINIATALLPIKNPVIRALIGDGGGSALSTALETGGDWKATAASFLTGAGTGLIADQALDGVLNMPVGGSRNVRLGAGVPQPRIQPVDRRQADRMLIETFVKAVDAQRVGSAPLKDIRAAADRLAKDGLLLPPSRQLLDQRLAIAEQRMTAAKTPPSHHLPTAVQKLPERGLPTKPDWDSGNRIASNPPDDSQAMAESANQALAPKGGPAPLSDAAPRGVGQTRPPAVDARPWEGPQSSIPRDMQVTISLAYDTFRDRGGRLDPQSWWQDMQAETNEQGTVGAKKASGAGGNAASRFHRLTPEQKEFLSAAFEDQLEQAPLARLRAVMGRAGYDEAAIVANIASITRTLEVDAPAEAPLSAIMNLVGDLIADYDPLGPLPSEVEKKLQQWRRTTPSRAGESPELPLLESAANIRERLRQHPQLAGLNPREMWATALWADSYDPARNDFDINAAARTGGMERHLFDYYLWHGEKRVGIEDRDRLQRQVRLALDLPERYPLRGDAVKYRDALEAESTVGFGRLSELQRSVLAAWAAGPSLGAPDLDSKVAADMLSLTPDKIDNTLGAIKQSLSIKSMDALNNRVREALGMPKRFPLTGQAQAYRDALALDERFGRLSARQLWMLSQWAATTNHFEIDDPGFRRTTAALNATAAGRDADGDNVRKTIENGGRVLGLRTHDQIRAALLEALAKPDAKDIP